MITCKFEDGGEGALRHAVVHAVMYRNDEVLLIKRADFLLEGGKWALPGGFVDRDETVEGAVRREVMEETGWKLGKLEMFSVYDDPNRPNEDRQNIAFNYACEATEKVGESDHEVADMEWVRIVDAVSRPLAFDHGDVVKEFAERYST